MRKDTRNAILPALGIILVLFVAVRVKASAEVMSYVDEVYREKDTDTEYWNALKEQHALQQKAFEDSERERLALEADAAQTELEERDRQLAAAAIARQRAQVAAAAAATASAQQQQTTTKVIKKQVVKKESRNSKAS